MKKIIPSLFLVCILLLIMFKCDNKSNKTSETNYSSRSEFLDALMYMNNDDGFNSGSTLSRCVDMWGMPNNHSFEFITDGANRGQTLVCHWNSVTVEGKSVDLTFSLGSSNERLLTNDDATLDKDNLHFAHLVQYNLK